MVSKHAARVIPRPQAAAGAVATTLESSANTSLTKQRGPLTLLEFNQLMQDFLKGVSTSLYEEYGYKITPDMVGCHGAHLCQSTRPVH